MRKKNNTEVSLFSFQVFGSDTDITHYLEHTRDSQIFLHNASDSQHQGRIYQ